MKKLLVTLSLVALSFVPFAAMASTSASQQTQEMTISAQDETIIIIIVVVEKQSPTFESVSKHRDGLFL